VASRYYTARALADLLRLGEFLLRDDPDAAAGTGRLIVDALRILDAHPLVGRPVGGGKRELVISRGRSGYIALYEYDPKRERVAILAIRHQREAGFEE
jgi:plasmid stabilization system protein ParE